MFNEIAEKMDALCRETGQASQDAYTRLQDAEDAVRGQKRPDESPVKYQARQATAKAALEDAKKQHLSVKYNLPTQAETNAKALRRQLEASISEKFAAVPSDVDGAVLTLLQSGILNPNEYVRLFEQATNPTMRRLIAKAAGDAAKNTDDAGAARILRGVEFAGQKCNGAEYLAAFDGLADINHRMAKNPSLYAHYEELAAPFLAALKA